MPTTVERKLTNDKLTGWVEEMTKLCRPDQVHWCDGSQAEYDRLCAEMAHSELTAKGPATVDPRGG